MLATARATMVDAVPQLARFIGGFYPHLPVHLWEFSLRQNRETLIIWESPDATVSCERDNGVWNVSVDSPGFTHEDAVTDFNEALSNAYQFICLASNQTTLEPTPPFPSNT